MSNNSSWSIDRTLSGATASGQSRPGSNGNEGVGILPSLERYFISIKMLLPKSLGVSNIDALHSLPVLTMAW